MRKYQWTLVLLVVGSMAASMLWLQRPTLKPPHSPAADAAAMMPAHNGEQSHAPQVTPTTASTLQLPTEAHQKSATKDAGSQEVQQLRQEITRLKEQIAPVPALPNTRYGDALSKMRRGMSQDEVLDIASACNLKNPDASTTWINDDRKKGDCRQLRWQLTWRCNYNCGKTEKYLPCDADESQKAHWDIYMCLEFINGRLEDGYCSYGYEVKRDNLPGDSTLTDSESK